MAGATSVALYLCLVLAASAMGIQDDDVSSNLEVASEGNFLLQVQTNMAKSKQVTHNGASNTDENSCPTDINGLAGKYNQIFPTGNRNAASFRWFSFIHKCAKEIGQTVFEAIGKGFCPISGSPIGGQNTAKVGLGKIGGGDQEGMFHFCCDPCICDMQDLVKVDTKTIDFGGSSKTYNVLVHGDPCKHPQKLNQTFTDPFSGKSASLGAEAPEVKCNAGKLEGAQFSDGGHPVIGILYEATGSPSVDGTTAQSRQGCQQRAKAGYNSGMGMIFRQVAKANPL